MAENPIVNGHGPLVNGYGGHEDEDEEDTGENPDPLNPANLRLGTFRDRHHALRVVIRSLLRELNAAQTAQEAVEDELVSHAQEDRELRVHIQALYDQRTTLGSAYVVGLDPLSNWSTDYSRGGQSLLQLERNVLIEHRATLNTRIRALSSFRDRMAAEASIYRRARASGQ